MIQQIYKAYHTYGGPRDSLSRFRTMCRTSLIRYTEIASRKATIRTFKHWSAGRYVYALSLLRFDDDNLKLAKPFMDAHLGKQSTSLSYSITSSYLEESKLTLLQRISRIFFLEYIWIDKGSASEVTVEMLDKRWEMEAITTTAPDHPARESADADKVSAAIRMDLEIVAAALSAGVSSTSPTVQVFQSFRRLLLFGMLSAGRACRQLDALEKSRAAGSSTTEVRSQSFLTTRVFS